MADFFSRLSERALGNATGVRPDLAPVIAWTAERNPSLENVDNEVTPTIRPQPRQTNLQTQQHDRPTLVTQAPPISTNDDGRDQRREPDVNPVRELSQPPIRKVVPEKLPAITSAPITHLEEPLVTVSSKSDHVPFSLEKTRNPMPPQRVTKSYRPLRLNWHRRRKQSLSSPAHGRQFKSPLGGWRSVRLPRQRMCLPQTWNGAEIPSFRWMSICASATRAGDE